MLKNIELCGRNVEYDLQRKKVKNKIRVLKYSIKG